MRLDANTDREDPIKGPLCLNAMVMLNGKFIDKVIVADEEEGYVEVYQQDDSGNLILDRDNDCAFTEVIHGEVKIIDASKVVQYTPVNAS